MEQLIEQYIESKRLAWSPTTLRSERHRLMAMSPYMNGDPTSLWKYLESSLKPYSRVTSWTRLTSFWQWLIDSNACEDKVNHYERFRKQNSRLFKNTYNPRLPSISFESAVERVKTIKDSGARALALQILGSGTRWTESRQSGDRVVGKGSKVRSIYKPETTDSLYTGSYSSFHRALRSVGLKPHDLRKLLATRLVGSGLKEADLLKVMGWSSMETAKFYLSPKSDDQLAQVFNKIHKELK